MYAFTCAHKEFPFGSKLRVTNPKNNKSVTVTVNYGAAKEIGFIEEGVGKVKIESLGRDASYVQVISPMPITTSGSFAIQVGSFKDKPNAYHLEKSLKLKYKNVYISTVYINGKKFHRVRLGPFKKRDLANSFAKVLTEEGYRILVTQKH
jgi:rare lipoprotein A